MKFLEHFLKKGIPHPNCIYYKDGHSEHYTNDGKLISADSTAGPLANPTDLVGQQPYGVVTWSLENSTGDIAKTAFESIAFALGITQWGLRLKNISFQRVPPGTGARIPIRFLSKSDSQFASLFPDDNILAVTYYPIPAAGALAGHMFFNDDEIWTLDGAPVLCSVALAKGWAKGCADPNQLLQTYKIPTVGRHEFGHALGMQHFPETKTDTMYPYYDQNTNSLGDDEVALAQTVYGIRTDVNPEEIKNVDKLVADNATFS